LNYVGKKNMSDELNNTSIYVSQIIAVSCPSLPHALPDWLQSPAIEPPSDKPTASDDDERTALEWEATLTPAEADEKLAAALAEFEPVRFEPLLTPEQARERLAAMVAESDEWIERIGADGRRGWDRPGQAIKTRWWETTSFDELPTWGDAASTLKPEPLARKRSTERQQTL
jgi:hypothetical protein